MNAAHIQTQIETHTHTIDRSTLFIHDAVNHDSTNINTLCRNCIRTQNVNIEAAISVKQICGKKSRYDV